LYVLNKLTLSIKWHDESESLSQTKRLFLGIAFLDDENRAKWSDCWIRQLYDELKQVIHAGEHQVTTGPNAIALAVYNVYCISSRLW